MRIRNRVFGGERPKRGERNLEEQEAILALDCELLSQELRALFQSSIEKSGISTSTNTIVNFNDAWFEFDEILDIVEYRDRLFWSGNGETRQATYAQLLGDTSYRMGIPTPDVPTNTSLTGTGTGTAFDTFYVVTFVNAYGEEGDKSGPSGTITVQTGQTATIGNIGVTNQVDSTIVTDSGITKQRIYRLAEGSPKFIAEISSAATSFSETIGDITVGESFSTEDFNPPPDNLQGLHLMANGIALGFVANERMIYVSEQNNINAWPYFFPVESTPIGISSYDNNAVILTDGFPEVAAINDPRNIVSTILTYREPCQSKRSIVQSEGGVMYASVNGVMYIGRGGGKLLTEDYLDQSDWARYVPTSMISLYKDGQYIGFHSGAKVGNAVVLDTRESGAILRQLSQRADAVYVLPGTDIAFVATGGQILQLEGSEDKLTYTYASKLFGQGSPYALTSRRILVTDQIDRSYVPFDEAVATAIYALRASELAARSALNLTFGIGGAINQFVIGGYDDWVIPGTSITESTGVTINGGGETDPPRITNYAVEFTLLGDKEVVHVEFITDDEDEKRITYHDRRRIYQYKLSGELDVQQIDIAGSNSEMHDGT